MTTTAPDWVSFDARKTQGLDLLGLRAPVQAIGNELLNGLTSVTPKVRYLTVITWITWRYAQSRLPDELGAFSKFAAAQEAVVVMANLLHSRAIGNLVGRDKAVPLLDSDKSTLPLEPLVQNIATNIYASAARQLRLTYQKDAGLHGLSRERGLPIALAFDELVSRTTYGSRLAGLPTINHIKREDLEELSKTLLVDRIPKREKIDLINAIMPAEPMDSGEQRRLATFALFLWLTVRKRSPIDEYDVFAAAREPPDRIPNEFRSALDGWLDYTIRDAIAAVHEAAFEAVMREVDTASARRRAPALATEVVAALLSAIEEHDDALRRIGLLSQGETVRQVTFAQMFERVERATADQVNVVNGLRRWRGGLSETQLYNDALDTGTGAVALLPIAWCLVARRTSSMPAGASPRNVVLLGAFFQLGIAAVVLPKIEEFRQSGLGYLDVMAELITRTVQQHVRVAWSRFAAPQGKDVAVLAADSETWARHNTFRAGRTNSRLPVAIDWLAQLGLTNEDGITPEGAAVLKSAVSTLAKH